jgi:anti-anti-sigma factor
MQITQHSSADGLELKLCGRLDANWAEHVSRVLEEAVRAGHHHVCLNLAQVDYLSSAGIRVLLKHYKQLKSVNGYLRAVQASEGALSVIKLAGLEALLVSADTASAPRPSENAAAARRTEMGGVLFEIYEQYPGASLSYSIRGNAEKFSTGGFAERDNVRLEFPAETMGVGLGAFGNDFADCRGRFGEFLAAAGTAVTLPTDGSSVPDFVIAEGQLVPRVNALYALTAAGRFAHLLRFEAKSTTINMIGLSSLIESAMQIVGTKAAGMVILAESAGVVGAALRRSPALAEGPPLAFPAVCDWLSFTTERTHERNLILVVGIAQRNPEPELAPFLRPLGPGTTAQGHFHAAIFPYRPLQKGNLDLAQSVVRLLATESAQSVMHLLMDDREFEGVGQTELMRGACWLGPIASTNR